MKNRIIFFIIVILSNYTFSQGADCLGAMPFCSDQTYTFPASTNTTAQVGPNYSCLGSQPNPAWYYLQIGTSGNIDITLTNSQNEDIDFVCWGPFSSPTSPCVSQLTYDDGNPGTFQSPCGGSGIFPAVSDYPCGNTVDCSFDPQETEVVNIPNAQAGDYYIVMITNYSGNSTDITAQQTGGSGSTNCAIVDPCDISSITTNVTSCDVNNNNYSVSGTVTFIEPPASGTLIIENCLGNQQTFNPPFGTTQNYNFTGLNSDGLNCYIKAYFTEDTTCSFTQNYNSPPTCMCNANVGTFNISINGNSTNNYILCDGDQISIQSNNDYTNPLDAGIINGATYSPNLGFAIYTCLPTPNTTPINDPCFSGFFTGTLGSFSETNNGGVSNTISSLTSNGVSINNNTIYIVPITLYNGTTQTYDASCFDLGNVIEITYLEEITTSYTENCNSNSSQVNINGSMPEFNNSDFIISNQAPSNIILSTTSLDNNTDLNITNIQAGDYYSFDITDNNGCTHSFNEGPFGGITVQISDTTICKGGTAIITPQIIGGEPPLTYLWDDGSITSSISVSPISSQTYCVTVLDNIGCSSGIKCVDVNIHPNIELNISNDTTICLGGNAQIEAIASAGMGPPYVYNWNNSLNNSSTHNVNPQQTTIYSVIVQDGCENQPKEDSVIVTVVPPPNYSFMADKTEGCPPLLVSFVSNNIPNNYIYNWNIEGSESLINTQDANYTFNTPGCWDVSLEITSPEGCITNHTIQDYICVDQPPIIDFDYTPLKPTSFKSSVKFINNTSGASSHKWYILENKDTIEYHNENISHKFPTEQGGKYTVCLISTNINGCSDTVCKTIIVIEELMIYVPNAFTPNGDNVNDMFTPSIIGEKHGSYTLRIFNRWGDIIFETNDKNEGWNGTHTGKNLKNDVYIWKIDISDNYNNKDYKYSGHISLIR